MGPTAGTAAGRRGSYRADITDRARPTAVVPYRLGCAVKVLGVQAMRVADGPDRRLSSQTIPYGTHPNLPAFDDRRQLDEAAAELRNASIPPLRKHADLVLPWDLGALVTAAPGPVDVMLEANAKDLALLELRRTLGVTRSDIAAAEERRNRADSPATTPEGQNA